MASLLLDESPTLTMFGHVGITKSKIENTKSRRQQFGECHHDRTKFRRTRSIPLCHLHVSLPVRQQLARQSLRHEMHRFSLRRYWQNTKNFRGNSLCSSAAKTNCVLGCSPFMISMRRSSEGCFN